MDGGRKKWMYEHVDIYIEMDEWINRQTEWDRSIEIKMIPGLHDLPGWLNAISKTITV